MKILIYGAGIIGCTYGWQLSKAGHDITVLVRENKKKLIEENGINIHCTDYRGRTKQIEQIIFHPKVIDNLSPDNDYEYIIVSVTCIHLKEILPILSRSAGKAHILFFQNMWNDFDEISNHLSPNQYFFGFPFIAGGGRDAKSINSIISGSKYSKTMLGEMDGKITPRIQKIAKVMESANMKPFISEQIVNWLMPHYAFIVGISVGIIKTGGTMKSFIEDREVIKDAIMAIREGFHICSVRGINPKKEKVNKLYYLPLFISIPVVKKIFKDESMRLMFEGYLKNSSDEIRKMLESVIESGEKYGYEIPHLKRFKKSIFKHL